MATTSMSRCKTRQLLGFGLLLAALGLAGCTGGLDGAFARLKRQPTSDVVPGVPSPAERLAALEEIRGKAGRMQPAEQQAITARLREGFGQEPDPAIRAEIVRTAASYRAEPVVALLRDAVSDPDADVRITACEVLGDRGDAEAVKLLSGVLSGDVDNDVRKAAITALGKTGDTAAVPALGEALEDRDPAMQYLAVQSLRETTGADLGNNVNDWRLYVRGEIPAQREPTSLAERLRRMF